MSSDALRLRPDDLALAASVAHTTLSPAVYRDWNAPAGDLEWSAIQTLDHIAEALTFYAICLSHRELQRVPFGVCSPVCRSNTWPEPQEALAAVEATASVLVRVVASSPPDKLAYHFDGPADPSGFVAMGCDEILVHTADIARGFSLAFQPPRDLCRRVLHRLFPWAPAGDSWEVLLWSNGRTALTGRPRLGPDWPWHCKPLAEWSGEDPTVAVRGTTG